MKDQETESCAIRASSIITEGIVLQKVAVQPAPVSPPVFDVEGGSSEPPPSSQAPDRNGRDEVKKKKKRKWGGRSGAVRACLIHIILHREKLLCRQSSLTAT